MARPPQEGEERAPTLADLASGAVPPKVARRIEQREPQRRRTRVRRPRSRIWGWLIGLFVLMLLGGGAAAAGLAWFLVDTGRTPREWAPYLERRAKGNHAVFMTGASWVAGYLRSVDLLERSTEPELPQGIGASAIRSGAPAPGARLVGNTAQLAAAIAAATPGQVITLMPGSYAIDGRGLRLDRPGSPGAPITLRAEKLGDAVITARAAEALKLSAPHWVIENLMMRGACTAHSDCEHAVHVVGNAQLAVIRNNVFTDFNAQIKINGEGGMFPDNGRIEGNTLVNATPRDTKAPITPIDLVAGSNWRIMGNFIADFQRKGGGSATYGAFMKGEGSGTVMERNLVLCEWKLRPGVGLNTAGSNGGGPNIGLSIGGGGTFPDAVKRELGKTGYEQSGGVIRDNLIAFCNDVGIYVNKGHRSTIAHNTMLDTAGIGVRFAESSADVVGNLVDGAVQARDGALVRAADNDGAGGAGALLGLFLGQHPVRELFRDVAKLDLRWRARPEPVTSGDLRRDLCGVERTGRVMPGAFEDYSQCRRP